MALRVEELQTAVVSTATLEGLVRERLQMIDIKIREADRVFGRNVIIVDLAVEFGVPGLDKREQQRFVYSKIIESLKQRRFDVKIWLGQDTTRLFIAYTIKFNAEQKAAMSEIIRETRIEREQIEVFCSTEWEESGAKNRSVPTLRPPPAPMAPLVTVTGLAEPFASSTGSADEYKIEPRQELPPGPP